MVPVAANFKKNGVGFLKNLHDSRWGTREFAIKDKGIPCTLVRIVTCKRRLNDRGRAMAYFSETTALAALRLVRQLYD
jgi:hypothetical protein